MADEYIVQCWYCLGEYDAVKAAWCGHPEPTKICPYCLNCSCHAPDDYKKKFWENAPPKMKLERVKLTSVKEKLGEILIANKVITSEQLLAALSRQEKTGEKLGQILIKMGLLTRDELEIYLLRQRKVPFVDIKNKKIALSLIEKIGIQTCKKYSIIPFDLDEMEDKKIIHVGMVNPYMPSVIKEVNSIFEAESVVYQMNKEDFRLKISEIEKKLAKKKISSLIDDEFKRKFTELINFALTKGAEDIYLESEFTKLKVSLRIDGVLFKIKNFEIENNKKFIKNLRTFVKAKGSEGVFSGKIGFKFRMETYTLKVSSVLSNRGEYITIKIIKNRDYRREITLFGFSEFELKEILEALNKKDGVIVVSAPLFNNSSILMYALMNYLKDKKAKILSFEEDINVNIESITQIERKILDKQFFLESIYKLEPDIVFVHDLRNPDVAKEIFRLSGNILFIIEIFAKSSIKSISQLIDHFNISNEQIADSLRLIINQRLIRKLCPDCKVKVKPTVELIHKFNLSGEDSSMYEFFKEKGCKECNFTGFKGRVPLYEVLEMKEQIRDALKRKVDEEELETLLTGLGIIPLGKNALTLAIRGITSISELMKHGFV